MPGKHPLLDAVNIGSARPRSRLALAASALALWLAGCGSDSTPKVTSDAQGPGDSAAMITVDGAGLDMATGTSTIDAGPSADRGPDVSLTFPDASTAICGNGILEPGERCDPAAKDEANRCPSVCPVQNCTTYKLMNKDTCQAQCVPDQAQASCTNGDRCCPAGCNANTDDDCQPMCGNNVQEPTETCDPLTNCPKTCPQERCNLRMLVEGGTCKAECRTQGTITKAVTGDNCCPAGVKYADDKDCDPLCDNGVKEADETCDPRESCPKSCPSIACQKYELKNPDTCRAVCVPTEKIVTCVNGDGCCAPGCNANNDSDCQPVCGNGVVESGETCEPGTAQDCPTTCPMVSCMTRQLAGDRCHARCETTGVFKQCLPVHDGCCPAGCNAQSGSVNFDGDCLPVCGNGVIEPGELCDATNVAATDCVLRVTACLNDAEHVSTSVGEVARCNFSCTTSQRPCKDNDGFCPQACAAVADATHMVDSDCKAGAGQPCGPGVSCGGGLFCTDGVCCTKQACGQCQKCSASDGQCAGFTGEPQVGSTCDKNTSTCAAGLCKLKVGSTGCVNGGTCTSNVCIGGVCCLPDCQAGSGADTQCAATACAPVTGACTWPGNATTCAVPVCKGGADAQSSDQPFCDGGGHCTHVVNTTCGTGVRCTSAAGTCPSTCAGDANCLGRYECVVMQGSCKLKAGEACTAGNVCACTDKATCNEPGKCNIITNGGAGQCIADCPGDKKLDAGTNNCVCKMGDNVLDPSGNCCKPQSDDAFCADHDHANCGMVTGPDNCGQFRAVASCGICGGPDTCGGGNPGTANVCGCTPQTDAAFCAANGKNCGMVSGTDNCGNPRTVASCGTCSGNQTCGGGNPGTVNVCGCTPQLDSVFCAANGKNCGSFSGTDNCGAPRTVASCGNCGTFETCGGGGTTNVCGCIPQSDAALCATLGKNCGSLTAATDNCGLLRDVASCGTCVDPKTCGGGGTSNVCGCSPQSDDAFCAANGGKNCGSVTGTDNCGNPRTVVSCGTCGGNQTCGGGNPGTANVCGCTPQTDAAFCAANGKNCGTVSGNDNCGLPRTVLSCGTCSDPQTCGGGNPGTANVCGCTPQSDAAFCAANGKNCGSVSGTDNCGAARTAASCGTCTEPQTCGGGGTDNVCGGP